MLFSSRVAVVWIRFSVWSVSGDAHVFVLLPVVIVTPPRGFRSGGFFFTRQKYGFRRRWPGTKQGLGKAGSGGQLTPPLKLELRSEIFFYDRPTYIQGGPKKVSHYQMIKKSY